MRTVRYVANYTYYWCYDDGGLGHDTSTGKGTRPLQATSDKAARIQAQDLAREFRSNPKGCHCHPGTSWVTSVTKTVHEETADGFSRTTTTELKLPEVRSCPCGKAYTPLRGETACHQLVPTP